MDNDVPRKPVMNVDDGALAEKAVYDAAHPNGPFRPNDGLPSHAGIIFTDALKRQVLDFIKH